MEEILSFKDKLLLAPMAGATDYAFRKLCIKWGADYTVSEMVSAKALCYKDAKTAVLARIRREEHPIAIQIFGSDPETMARAAKMLATGDYKGCVSEITPVAIDINMGCPVHKIVSNGEGSALMKDPIRAYEIMCAVKEGSPIPVTVKIRAGFDKNHICAPQYAEMAERAGLAAVCIHGRTREQMYTPPVDLDVIKDTVAAVSIPVIGNGEIMSVDDALKMKDYTGCSSLMIARGALGNPFLFAQIKDALEGKEIREIGYGERIRTAMSHLDLLIADKGQRTGLLEARKHIAWYIKGMPGAPAIRDRVNRIEDYESMRAILQEQLDRS
ncbi:MAG: tRNA dihydrouridine synthase DusB [Clostridia bacterium]|nr:tRNA dihydrouridine synthase DusB [Clostridia bacterium]